MNHRLTTRELETFRHSCRGLTNIQIAQRLDVEVTTVKNHLTAAYRKFRTAGCGDAPWGNRATRYCYLLGLADAKRILPDYRDEWG